MTFEETAVGDNEDSLLQVRACNTMGGPDGPSDFCFTVPHLSEPAQVVVISQQLAKRVAALAGGAENHNRRVADHEGGRP